MRSRDRPAVAKNLLAQHKQPHKAQTALGSMAKLRNIRSNMAATLMLLAALLAAAARPAAAALFAIDLGTEFLKVSVVKPGRIPISIVINEMSKRKTPALVGFVSGDRLVGEEAAALTARHPDKIVSHLRDLLGRPADHGRLRTLRQINRLSYPLEAAANRSWAAAVRTGGGEEGPAYSAEELVASLLEYARRLAVAAADGAPVNDAVLVVPPFFTPQQRQVRREAPQPRMLPALPDSGTSAACR